MLITILYLIKKCILMIVERNKTSMIVYYLPAGARYQMKDEAPRNTVSIPGSVTVLYCAAIILQSSSRLANSFTNNHECHLMVHLKKVRTEWYMTLGANNWFVRTSFYLTSWLLYILLEQIKISWIQFWW